MVEKKMFPGPSFFYAYQGIFPGSRIRYLTRMVFRFVPPARNLSPYIKGYLEADSRNLTQATEHPLFPNGYSGIFFNFGLGKLVLEKEYLTPPVSIFGQIDQHFKVLAFPGFYSLGVLLKPTVLSRYLGVDMTEFTNRATDGRLVRPDFKCLYAMLEDARSMERTEILDRYFTKAFCPLMYNTTMADAAVQSIHQQPQQSVKQIAANLGISERYLEAQFRKAVGLSPKTYSLIIRFKNAEQHLSNVSSSRWSLLDLSADYYDQNHFIKDFKRFTGHTPSDYLTNDLEMGRSYLVR